MKILKETYVDTIVVQIPLSSQLNRIIQGRRGAIFIFIIIPTVDHKFVAVGIRMARAGVAICMQ